MEEGEQECVRVVFDFVTTTWLVEVGTSIRFPFEKGLCG